MAAMTRTSTLTGCMSPIGCTSLDSRKRRSLGCTSSVVSPISSRNSVPPVAARMMPEKFSVAPVKEPRRWPNSCESSMSFGVALQLKGRKGSVGAGGVGVNHAREHLLAGAGFAGDEDGHVRRRDAARRGQERLHLFGEE